MAKGRVQNIRIQYRGWQIRVKAQDSIEPQFAYIPKTWSNAAASDASAEDATFDQACFGRTHTGMASSISVYGSGPRYDNRYLASLKWARPRCCRTGDALRCEALPSGGRARIGTMTRSRYPQCGHHHGAPEGRLDRAPHPFLRRKSILRLPGQEEESMRFGFHLLLSL